MALNEFVCMGRMVRDPEIKRFETGTAISTFTLAVERDFKDKETGKREADFINFVAYKAIAEHVKTYYQKGSMAVVRGRLQIRKWQDKEGNNRYTTEVIVGNIYFGESKKSHDSSYESGADEEWKEVEDAGELPF